MGSFSILAGPSLMVTTGSGKPMRSTLPESRRVAGDSTGKRANLMLEEPLLIVRTQGEGGVAVLTPVVPDVTDDSGIAGRSLGCGVWGLKSKVSGVSATQYEQFNRALQTLVRHAVTGKSPWKPTAPPRPAPLPASYWTRTR